MKFIHTFIIAAAILCTTVSATAQRRQAATFVQSDGTSVTVSRVHKGQIGFYATNDGLALLRNAQGDFCYTLLQDTMLVATDILAHNFDERSADEQRAAAARFATASEAMARLFPHTQASRRHALKLIPSTNNGIGSYGESLGGVVPSIGKHRIPVVMAEFADKTFQPYSTKEKITRWLNEEGYNDEKLGAGSVRDYFYDQSNGMLELNYEVVAKVTLPQNYAYYGADANGRIDPNRNLFFDDVIRLAQEQGVDFSQYVAEGASGVYNVAIVFAGQGEQSSSLKEAGSDDYLWACFVQGKRTYNGVPILSFFISNEVFPSYVDDSGKLVTDSQGNYITQSVMTDGIGVFCHEMGHALGLPDFYYTGSDHVIPDTLNTMGLWSVMDMGNYVNNGYWPVGYNAYELACLGWMEAVELKEAQVATLAPIYQSDSEHPRAYIIRNATVPTDFLMLENRQQGKWYPSAMGHGMLVTHVDYNASIWSANIINNTPDHQRFSYIPADDDKGNVGMQSKDQLQGDLFPGTTGKTSLTDNSSAFPLSYYGPLNKPLFDIHETEEQNVVFTFIDPSLTAIGKILPESTSAEQVYTLDGRSVKGAKAKGLYIIKSHGASRLHYHTGK